MRVIVDNEVRYDGVGNYAGIESAPSVGPCFGSTVSVREFRILPLAGKRSAHRRRATVRKR